MTVRMERLRIDSIPAILYGDQSDKLYIFVHGKMGSKRDADDFAEIAAARGYQVLSFDLPDHGDRKYQPAAGEVKNRCTVQQAVPELRAVLAYAQERWNKISLFGCSIGAYFSLMAFQNVRFERCLFQSPVVDMPHLIGKMFLWFGVTEAQLEQAGEIETPVDVLSWPYYRYAMAHPVTEWPSDTHILYADGDDLQDFDVMQRFADQFGCLLTVAEGCNHAFNGDGQPARVHQWMKDQI